jgi:hypothetical protein
MKKLLKLIALSALLYGCSTNDFVPDNRVYNIHNTTTIQSPHVNTSEKSKLSDCLSEVNLVEVPLPPTERLRSIRGQREQDAQVIRILVDYTRQLNEALAEQQKLVRAGCH